MGKYLLIFLSIIIAAFLESTIFPFNLLLLIIISFALFGPPIPVFLTSFFSGIFLDILKGRPLGLSSSVFLLSSTVLVLYKKKFKLEEIRLSLPFSFLIVMAVNYYFKAPLLPWKAFLETSFLLIITPFVKFFFVEKGLKV